MNLLALAQAVKRESGLTSTGPTAFANATGDDLRMFHWVISAWREIDLEHEHWLWRRASASATTSDSMRLSPTGVAPGFALTDFGSWLPEVRGEYAPSTYKVSEGVSTEHALAFLRYDTFRSRFVLGSHDANGLQYWTVHPDGSFMVGPTPDEDHVVNADYVKGHTALDDDDAEPTMPERFHMLIVWEALRQYGGYDAASEIWQRADRNARALRSGLGQAQLPAMRWKARPLA